MSALKDQDPDYGLSIVNDEKHRRIYEENARSNAARKMTAIIEREFSKEIDAREKEVLEIQERLHRASKALHLLRYVIVTDFYNRKQCQNSQSGEARQQTRIHPAVKELLIGKSPKACDSSLVPAAAAVSTATLSNGEHFPTLHSFPTSPSSTTGAVLVDRCCTLAKSAKVAQQASSAEYCRLEKRSNETDEEDRSRPKKKVPRYIPPKSGIPESPCPSTRGIRHKVRKRIIIGNISKWIPPEWREDAASHKWTMYVRGNKENPDIDDFVSKVRFFLHPSYRPNDVVEVTTAPFCLSRRGWGEFPLRVQLHFKSVLNKPMDIIHHLKLDRTYTGLQTLGSETLVDIWIYADHQRSKRNGARSGVCFDENRFQTETQSDDSCGIKVENEHLDSFRDFSNNSVLESMHSTSKNRDATVEQEPLPDIGGVVDENSSVRTEKLRGPNNVELDHDYCGSKYLSNFEGHSTIDHSPLTSRLLMDLPVTNEVVEENVEQKTEAGGGETPENTGLSMHESSMNGDPSASLISELDRNKPKPLSSSCSKIQSNLRPLKISIPPLFESSNKHVLVLRDGKAIPVPRVVGNDSIKSKINYRGISLLKKPPGSSLEGGAAAAAADSQQGLKLQLSRSVLLNVNSHVPALKIAERRNFENDHQLPNVRELDCKLGIIAGRASSTEESKEPKLRSRQKITLGKDEWKLESRKEFCDEMFGAIETAPVASIQGLLAIIVRRMPIVTRDALDSDYRQAHPYACASEAEFFGYTVAKRTACEWNRASAMRCLLKQKAFPEETVWTIKEIMIWSRLHGHTPLCSDFRIRSTQRQKNLPDTAITKSTYTEPEALLKWLQTCPGRLNDQCFFDANLQQSDELDVDVDIASNEISPGNKGRTRVVVEEERSSKAPSDTKISVLELESKFVPLYDFVCDTAREIGGQFMPEEIVPGAMHCAASRAMMRAVECLVDDLVRMSLAKAWERCSDNGHPKLIVLDDVHGALLSREEFDIFTNQGLGSRYQPTAME